MLEAKTCPNFLYIMTDQLRADWLSCAGHPVVRTPNIDALASQGTRFTRFHVASPVCMPNRASLLTGRFPTSHGLRTNGCTLPRSANTFVDVLREEGYRTASIGKSHIQPMTGTKPIASNPFETGPIEDSLA
ncbi:MAG: sulfatase-like hydrolase/transferase [Chromatiales bacterium]|nr:sulfatase-like hydrolase/transferase [Chromatiales bacterium]